MVKLYTGEFSSLPNSQAYWFLVSFVSFRIPVLVCQAGKDAFVDNEGQNHFVKTAPNAKLLRFPEAKHEIYASGGQIQEQYFKALLKFYQSFV